MKAPPYIGISASMRDESPFLREWLEYHRLVGVERFFLLTNDPPGSEEHTKINAILAPYIRAGIVELHDWIFTGNPRNYAYATDEKLYLGSVKTAHWVIRIDLDEFIVPTGELTLRQVLDAREKNAHVAGIGLNWCHYGSSGLIEYPELQTRDLVMRAHDDHSFHRTVKSAYIPSRCQSFGSAHHVIFDDKRFARYRPDGRMSSNGKLQPRDWSLLRLNHYRARSRKWFEAKAIRNGAAGVKEFSLNAAFEEAWVANDLNATRDDLAWRLFGSELLTRLASPIGELPT